MLKGFIFIILLLSLLGVSTTNATNKVPIATLTKGCKPMINNDLEIKKVPITALSERSYKTTNKLLALFSKPENIANGVASRVNGQIILRGSKCESRVCRISG